MVTGASCFAGYKAAVTFLFYMDTIASRYQASAPTNIFCSCDSLYILSCLENKFLFCSLFYLVL
jgi:hypothetical protein